MAAECSAILASGAAAMVMLHRLERKGFERSLLEQNARVCPYCKKLIDNFYRVCPLCNTSLEKNVPVNSKVTV